MHPASPGYMRPPLTADAELIARSIDRMTGAIELAIASLDKRLADLTLAIHRQLLSAEGPAELVIPLTRREVRG